MAKRYLTLDIGASAVKLAEFEGGKGGLTLVNYGIAALAAPLDAGNAGALLSPALLDIVREKGIKPGPVAISISGQMVFPRFASIAAAGGAEKFDQMIRFEIEQNIPFPIDEMICDRQVLGDNENGEKNVMIVAAKTDQVEDIAAAVRGAGFTPELVDVAPIAITNVLRYAGAAEDGCCVLLDIGSKTTSLVIADGDKLYNRSIPVAGNTITKEIASALGCTAEEAEAYKREAAYVALGGVVEDEDETRDRVSKVCRAVSIDPAEVEESTVRWSLRGVMKADGEPPTVADLAHDVEARCSFGDFALVVIDSASCLIEGDENSSVDVRRFFAHVLRIARATGAAVLVVHHYGKTAAGDRDSIDRARGSSVWGDSPDAPLSLTEIFPKVGELVGNRRLTLSVAAYHLINTSEVQCLRIVVQLRVICGTQEVIGCIICVDPDLLCRMSCFIKLVADRSINCCSIQEILIVVSCNCKVQSIE